MATSTPETLEPVSSPSRQEATPLGEVTNRESVWPITLASLGAAAFASANGWPQVPGYVVLGELGAGAMGVVYSARQVAADRVSCRAEMGLASATYEQHPSLRVFKDELLPMVVGPMRKMLVLDPDKTWSKVLGLFIEAGGLFLQGQIAAHKPPAWRLERQLAGEAKLDECAALIKKEHGEWHLHRYIPLFRLGGQKHREKVALASAAVL
jgi:hypothetical protein